MYGTKVFECEYRSWWERKTTQHNQEKLQVDDRPTLLPEPVFPLALDFDPEAFTLPPSYDEAVDVEKGIPYGKSVKATSPDPTVTSPPRPTRLPHAQLSGLQGQIHHVRPNRFVQLARFIRYTMFTVYRRLFTFVIAANLVAILILLYQFHSPQQDHSLSIFATFASSNFLLAILVRQDYLINILYRTTWLVPWSLPLWFRRTVSRIYCYGGIHSGAAVAGTLWWLIFTVGVCWVFATEGLYTLPTTIIASFTSVLLLTILLLSLPGMRRRYHDTFEITHRFIGWTSIALFWTQTILLALYSSQHALEPTSFTLALVHDPTFWNLSIITAVLVYPWLRIRRKAFTAQPLSSHAIRFSFPQSIHRFSCLSISSSPLLEWHPFATFPTTRPNETGASMVISSAGNWTQDLIQRVQFLNAEQIAQTSQNKDKEKRDKKNGEVEIEFWVRPHPRPGVLSLSLLYPRVLILTTGSGIGPSLSSLLDRPTGQHARLIWSTRSPLATYGQEIHDLVLKADSQAVVIDTDAMGRPDLLELAYRMYIDEELEAVFVLSNEKVVKWVVSGLEKRGVPAFGPIWDS